jgi:hypothetical protein
MGIKRMIQSYADTHPGLRGAAMRTLSCTSRIVASLPWRTVSAAFPMARWLSGNAVEMLRAAIGGGLRGSDGLVRKISVAIAKRGAELKSGTIGTTLTSPSSRAVTPGLPGGDSLAYMVLPDGTGVQLTREQTVAEEYRRAGRTNIEPYLEHVLTQCLGQEREGIAGRFRARIPGGRPDAPLQRRHHKTIDDASIYEAVRSGADPKSIVDKLIRTANERAGG